MFDFSQAWKIPSKIHSYKNSTVKKNIEGIKKNQKEDLGKIKKNQKIKKKILKKVWKLVAIKLKKRFFFEKF